MTRDQLGACIALDQQGFKSVPLPGEAVPGHILMASADGDVLLMVKGDGTVVDLLAVYLRAEDCVRNWGKDRSMPNYIGDWPRLTKLAQEINGRTLAQPILPIAGRKQGESQ